MKAMEVTRYILQKAKERNKIVTNLKLQKILYDFNIEFIRNNSKPLIEDSFEAWPHCAVIRNIYNKFSFFASNNIFLLDYELEDKNNLIILNKLDNKLKELLEIKPYSLDEFWHKPNSAWHKNYEKGKNNTIPLKDILEEARNIDKDNKCFHI